MPKKPFLDVLGDDSDDSSEDEQDAQQQQDADDGIPKPADKKLKIDLETLERCGYKGGPSVLYVPPPKEGDDGNWAWSDGKTAKVGEEDEESREQREQNRRAVTDGVDASAQHAAKAAEYAAKLREEKRAEAAELARERKLTFNQKEKRKRDTGQASRGKNFVEEEKRQARAFGQYSGFD